MVKNQINSCCHMGYPPIMKSLAFSSRVFPKASQIKTSETSRNYQYCNGKSIEAQRTYTIQCGETRTLYHCAPCARSFSETRHTPIAQLKTPIALVVQVLSALTEGVGINAATRLYGVSKKSIYRWQE